MKIIIVDDDRVRAEGLKHYLIKKQAVIEDEVFYAECAIEAKLMLKANYFDVLILDIVLPLRVGEKPRHEIGISLLERISRSKGSLKKPEKIIGITSYVENISSYSTRFAKHCRTVIEAPANSDEWKPTILNALSYTVDSKICRAVSNKPITVLTVHGIRTFGKWQSRLAKLAESYSDSILFNSYKYLITHEAQPFLTTS